MPQAVQLPGVAGDLQQHVQHGRHEVGEGDALLGDHAQQVVRVAFAAGPQDHQPRAGHQRQEDLVDGDVEGQRCLEQRRVVVAEAQDLVDLPQQALADRFVPDHRALGPPGRTGREDHVGQGVAGDGDPGPFGGVGSVPPVAQVDGHGFWFTRVVLSGVVELQHDAGVLDDDGPARGGPLRIERYERTPRLEHTQQPDHHVGGAAQGDAHDLFGGEPAFDQMVSQLTGQLRRLTVGQRSVLVDDGHGVRPGPRLLAEHLHDGRADPVGPGVVPLGQGLEPGRRSGGADGADGPVREVGQVVQRELRFGRHDIFRDGDAPAADAVRAGLPTSGPVPAVVDPPEDVGEQSAGVRSMPSGLRPVAQYDSPMAHASATVLPEKSPVRRRTSARRVGESSTRRALGSTIEDSAPLPRHESWPHLLRDPLGVTNYLLARPATAARSGRPAPPTPRAFLAPRHVPRPARRSGPRPSPGSAGAPRTTWSGPRTRPGRPAPMRRRPRCPLPRSTRRAPPPASGPAPAGPGRSGRPW